MNMARAKTVSRYLCGLLYVVAGVNHFVNTDFYVSIMPPYLPWHLALVYVSGVAEVVLGAGLLVLRWSRVAAWGVIALLVAVFPANVHMALNPELFAWANPVGLLIRLPIQGLLVAWAYWHTRPDRGTPAAATHRPSSRRSV
jgi:uncharacterized membrane protein